MADKDKCIIKKINFFGRHVKIVMQNENGPCPLLAIANVLSLRNELKLPSGIREITQDELITSIVDLLLERSKHFEAAYAADYQQNISEIFPVLQKLTTGVDVNVKFHSLHAFEPTPEVAVFDLLGIPLVHGWLVDPQDATTAAVFGNRSYNELVELLFLVLGDEEMEALSIGPLRNLSISSHHMQHSFSHTGSPPAVLRNPSALTAPTSRTHSFAAHSASQPADLTRALQSLSLQQQQQQQQQEGSRASTALQNGCKDSPQQQQQQPQQLEGAAAAAEQAGCSSTNSSSGAGHQPEQGLQQQQALGGSVSSTARLQHTVAGEEADAAIEACLEAILQEVCCTVQPGTIELGESPTHNTILTRRLAYEGPGRSRLNPSTTGPAAGAAGPSCQGDSSRGQAGPSAALPAAAAAGAAGQQPGSALQPSQQPDQQQQERQAPVATAADAAVVRAFMEVHCSQLTPYGLACMADDLKEHQLAVFFRNNHFNALFKYEGAVYLLVTDQGYEYEPDIVWERLDSVQGDTTFCTGDFTPFVPHRAPENAAGLSYTQVVAGGSAAAAAGGNIAALTDLDAAIAASLAVEDDHSQPCEAAADAGHHADADFALALQLQLQEEEAAAAAAARAQQQQQQQPPRQQGSRLAAVQQQEQASHAQPLESLRQVGQRLASGIQQQYAAAASSLAAQQQPQQQQQAQRRSTSGLSGGRKPAQEEKCSLM